MVNEQNVAAIMREMRNSAKSLAEKRIIYFSPSLTPVPPLIDAFGREARVEFVNRLAMYPEEDVTEAYNRLSRS